MGVENRGESSNAKPGDGAGGKSEKRLNDLVAVTVVILTVFLAVSKIKDDNVVQAMQKAQSISVDAWAEYQAARIKLHIAENSLSQLRLLETGIAVDKALTAKQASEYESEIKKYQSRSKETMAKAKALEVEYDRLNGHDDQFDLSEAFISIAIAVSAVAALVDNFLLLYFAWASGAVGVVFGLAGFMSWNIRLEWLIWLLGT